MKFVDGVVNKFWKEAHALCIVSRNLTILVRNMSFIGDKSKRIPGSAGAEDVCWDKQGHRRVVYTQTQSTWLHKYKYTYTQIHKFTNAQIHKYTYMYMGTDKYTGMLSELKHNVQCKIHSNAKYTIMHNILTVYIIFSDPCWQCLIMSAYSRVMLGDVLYRGGRRLGSVDGSLDNYLFAGAMIPGKHIHVRPNNL